MRTRTDSASAGLPITRATAPSDLSLDSKPNIRKSPNSVGKAASATLTVFMSGSIARGFGLLREQQIVGCAAASIGSERSEAEVGPRRLDLDGPSPGIGEDE